MLEALAEIAVARRDDGGERLAGDNLGAKFGPERTATGRPVTSADRRLPVAGSSPLLRLRTGALPGRRRDDLAETRLGTATQTRSASATGASSIVAPATPSADARVVARVLAGLVDRARELADRGAASVTSWSWRASR